MNKFSLLALTAITSLNASWANPTHLELVRSGGVEANSYYAIVTTVAIIFFTLITVISIFNYIKKVGFWNIVKATSRYLVETISGALLIMILMSTIMISFVFGLFVITQDGEILKGILCLCITVLGLLAHGQVAKIIVKNQ